MDNTRIFDAIEFATQAHRGQYRKGSKIPYIIHPLRVGTILIDHGYDNNIVIAGFLHDTIEDTPIKIEMISKKFGEEVASIVMGCTEVSEINTWEARKEATLTKLKSINDVKILIVTAADKLDNIRSIEHDYKKVNDEVWNRFKRPKEKQQVYYSSLAEIFLEKYHTLSKEQIFLDCSTTINNFFNNMVQLT